MIGPFRFGMRLQEAMPSLIMDIRVQYMLLHGRTTGHVSSPGAWITPPEYGMWSVGELSSPTQTILIQSMHWSGHPIAHALLRQVPIKQSRSGTLPTGEMSLSTKDIPMMSQPLIGGPRILPQEVMIKLYKYGMRSPGLSRTLIPATPKT